MAQTVGTGTYVPYYRIRRSSIAEQTGASPIAGETAVPNHDEDVVTMATKAAENTLESADIEETDLNAVFAASVSDPFAERGIAGALACILDTDAGIRVADFGSSARATAAAIEAGRDGIEAGRIDRALVVATDVLPAEQDGEFEQTAGAGAGALLLDTESRDGELLAVESETTGFPDPVRPVGRAPLTGHARF